MLRARWFALVPTAWAILACGNGMPIDLGQEFRAPMEDPPEAEIPEFPEAVALDDALEAELVEHLELLFHAESGEGPFCEALDNARLLAKTVERHLNDVKGQDPRAFAKGIAELDAQLPGVALRLTDAGVVSWHAPEQLAGYSDGNSTALLQASAKVLHHPQPGWLQTSEDGSTCSEPSVVAEPLLKVAERWSLAAGCVRSSMKDPLRRTLRDMALDKCFCRDRATTRSAAEALNKPLDRLPDLGGASLLRLLDQSMTAPDAQFGGTCSG